ncbi:MAG: hypothetical protein IPM63_18700 [Acidobacteriota bacterium]|nr:MAG: hypothetical protein IPM63_18700 [Acidobacteriota bacterium]
MRPTSLPLLLLLVITTSCTAGKAGPAAGAAIPECDPAAPETPYDRFFSRDDGTGLALAGRVSSVLEELSAGRDRYLRTGEPVELFPTIYYHTTRFGFDLALRDGNEEGPVLLDMILRFYDAYKNNRDRHDTGKAPEAHWMPFFEAASAADPDIGIQESIDILNEGVDAHILYDVPRFVRRMRDEGTVDEAVLRSAFKRFDEVFDRASEDLRKDLSERDPASAGMEFDSLFRSAASMVRFKRARGFELGMSDRPLATVEPQPVLEHDPGSRKFFPEQLLRRGICR